MQTYLNQPLQIGSLLLKNRLIQGPLAGYSCAPFRKLIYQYTPPAYCVSEMISAHDVVHKHLTHSRYLFRASQEQILCYQLAGNEPALLVKAALRLESIGADLIDLNCGCPKDKIRKKGLGSALLSKPDMLIRIINTLKDHLKIPLTVKIRIQSVEADIKLAQAIEQAGADALIIHGRRWQDNYDVMCDYNRINAVKHQLTIPVIANGDITNVFTLEKALEKTQCDGFMISRAGTGRPWIFKQLLEPSPTHISPATQVELLMTHLCDLALLEDEYKALLQARSLVRYYFRNQREHVDFASLYECQTLADFEQQLNFLIQKSFTLFSSNFTR